jgi:hypothetical protein
MSFLAPLALFGTFLLAIPIIVHLFKPRKMRHTLFSSLRWLRQTPQTLTRRIQLHQILLFVLRVAFILLLVLALAKPLIGGGAGEGGRYTDRYIILDVSRSMGYKSSQQRTPMDRAREVAEKLLAVGGQGDRTAVLLTGSSSRFEWPDPDDWQNRRAVETEAYLSQLRKLKPTASDTNLSSALEVIRASMDDNRPDTDVELYFITDNHQHSWRQSEIAAFLKDFPDPSRVRVSVIDVGSKGARNAWIADARLLRGGARSKRLLEVEVGYAGEAKVERTVRLLKFGSMPEQTRNVTIESGRSALVRFEVALPADPRNLVAEIKLEPADSLPDDDHYFLNLDQTAGVHVLLVGSERATIHLGTALEALDSAMLQPIKLLRRSATEVNSRDINDADVIFLADVPELTEARLHSLERRVKAGAGLVVFLGPNLKPAFWNKLFRQRSAQSLLPFHLKTVISSSGTALSDILWTHPLLAPLYDPRIGDLPRSRFKAFYRLAPRVEEPDEVLARIDNVPAIVEHPYGTGKAIVFNTSPNDDWGDLCKRHSFVPLVDHLLSYLSAGGVRRTFEVGKPISLPLAGWQSSETVTVRGPRGDKLTPSLVRVRDRTFMRMEEVAEPGVYRVERQGPTTQQFSIVVQMGRGDSVLTPMDTATLAKWWGPVSFKVLRPEEAARKLGSAPPPMWHWLVLLAALVLMGEIWLAHWLCPRPNPTAAHSIVHEHGMLRPKTKVHM